MSFIERALEQMRQETAAASTERSEPGIRPVQQPTERRAETPQRVVSAETIRPMPSRSDRTVRIDLSALRAAGVIAPENEERRLAEEYRIIKRPLLNAMTVEGALNLSNIVVVTSAVPGEGKTFTSINLALSLALERNREVVLIDGDVAKRHITHLFGLDEEAGFLDVGGASARDFDEVILKTDYPSLYVLPAGNPDVEATEILASERTSSMLAALASEPRRIVLIDSPPLLVTSEAGVLTSLAGQVVLVVRASETPQDIVVRAVESIADDKPISLLLNQVLAVPERGYGYYGGYGDYGKKAGGSPVGESPGQ